MEEQNKKEESSDQEGSPKKNSMTGVVVGIIVVAVVFGLIALIGSSASNSGGSTSDNSTASGCSNPNLKQQAQTVDYKQLEKDPTSFDGTVAEFTGQIIQIQQSGNQGVIRLAVDQIFGGVWNPSDVVYVTYQGNTDAVQGDVVNIYGPITGAETYTSQANFQITLPSMTGCIIEEASSSSPTAASPSTPVVNTPVQPKTQNTAPTAQPATSQPTPAPKVSSPPPAPKTWHTVTTFTTATTENTPPFAIQGTEWRATWNCQATLPVNTAPMVYAESTNGMGGGGSVAEPNTCPSGNTTYFYSGPGSYYLQINIYDPATMTVTIEDYY